MKVRAEVVARVMVATFAHGLTTAEKVAVAVRLCRLALEEIEDEEDPSLCVAEGMLVVATEAADQAGDVIAGCAPRKADA